MYIGMGNTNNNPYLAVTEW